MLTQLILSKLSQRNLSIYGLARELNLNFYNLNRYIKGLRTFPYLTLIYVCHYLGITIEELYYAISNKTN